MKKLLVIGSVLSPLALLAADTAPDASAIVTTATTTFNAVGTLCAAAVGFFVVVKIVKWIRR